MGMSKIGSEISLVKNRRQISASFLSGKGKFLYSFELIRNRLGLYIPLPINYSHVLQNHEHGIFY